MVGGWWKEREISMVGNEVSGGYENGAREKKIEKNEINVNNIKKMCIFVRLRIMLKIKYQINN
ncbi:MAG: hypothetical protein IKR83_07235 [Bacteroidales bacterium]|nr:hypothetical protein [Bacteroidales bacterium]